MERVQAGTTDKAPAGMDVAPAGPAATTVPTDWAPAANAASVRVQTGIRDVTTIRQTPHPQECTVARVDAAALTTIEAGMVVDKNAAMNMRTTAGALVAENAVENVAGGIALLTK